MSPCGDATQLRRNRRLVEGAAHVGKSTTAVNVSAALATKGYRTLLADCDPQANASEMFIPENEIEFDFRSIIADRTPVEKVIQRTRIDRLTSSSR
jgi:chromosome partitioning protein